MRYHVIALCLGFLLDLLLGDPHWMPHPIRLIGAGIIRLERLLLGGEEVTEDREKRQAQRELGMGRVLVLLMIGVVILCVGGILTVTYLLHPVAGCAAEAIMTYQILALKCLKVESMKVYTALMTGDVEAARTAVSMIVGRDTKVLDAAGITRAAVETVAENTSDGVIAPLLYTALGGPVLGFVYKTINTMDSMVGYKNDRYLYFGRAAARLDDVVNFLPARISAGLMIAACFFFPKSCNPQNAMRIYRRDRYHHTSPNSAHTESVVAGAFGIRLAGDAWYFGKLVKKPYLGDDTRPIETEDIKRVNHLMYVTAFLCFGICLAVFALGMALHSLGK
ncbi:MAG: adenosylcobinamide-phosphate synthase CbiB [Roseburia sp.]